MKQTEESLPKTLLLKSFYAYDADFCLVFVMKVLLEPWS